MEGRGKDLSSGVRKAEVSAACGVENTGRKIQDRKLEVCQRGRQKVTSVKNVVKGSFCMEQRFWSSQSSQSAKIQRQVENYSSTM